MKRFVIIGAVLLFLTDCSTSATPEMKEFMAAFGSSEKMTACLDKYAANKEVVPKALATCNLGKPNITETQKKDGMIVYTVESVVEKCERSETAVGTVRVFDISWKNGKIVKFAWKGPKSGKVEY